MRQAIPESRSCRVPRRQIVSRVLSSDVLCRHGADIDHRGHADFSESTEEVAPLTEEEKTARLEELRQKLKEKRANRSILDREEAKKNEVRSSRP